MQQHAFLAHANPPLLSTHDRFGERRDQVGGGGGGGGAAAAAAVAAAAVDAAR